MGHFQRLNDFLYPDNAYILLVGLPRVLAVVNEGQRGQCCVRVCAQGGMLGTELCPSAEIRMLNS